MSYLLDTNIVIYHLNGVPDARRLLAGMARQGVSMSIVTYMEALEGVLRSSQVALARQQLNELVESTPILPFRIEEAERCAHIRDDLRRRGRRVRSRSLDLIIAATAVERGLSLVTNNPQDYRDITGLTVIAANIP